MSTNMTLESLAGKVDENSASITALGVKFDVFGSKIDDVVNAVVDLAHATGAMDARLTSEIRGIGVRLTGVETRLGNVENRVEGLEGKVEDLTVVVRSVDRRLSVVEAR